jgi:hypothetical protein
MSCEPTGGSLLFKKRPLRLLFTGYEERFNPQGRDFYKGCIFIGLSELSEGHVRLIANGVRGLFYGMATPKKIYVQKVFQNAVSG